MVRPKNHGDDVLPFMLSDIVNGVGKIEKIIALDECERDYEGVHDGRCRYCGYDRGTFQTHTEVDAGSITCRQCDAVLGGWE